MTTWDPANTDASITLSGGNLTATAGAAGWISTIATGPGRNTGKRYWRIKGTTSDYASGGISISTESNTTIIGSDANGWLAYASPGNPGQIWHNGSTITGGTPIFVSSGDYFVVACDYNVGKIYFTTQTAAGVLNTNWNLISANPSTSVGGYTFTPPMTLMPAASLLSSGDVAVLDVTSVVSDATLSGFLPYANVTTQAISTTQGEIVTAQETLYPHVTSPPNGVLGYQHLAPTTVTGLYVPPGARWAEIMISGAVVSMRDDGVQPTATLGAKLPVGGPYIYASNLHQVLFYSASGTVDVVYYAP